MRLHHLTVTAFGPFPGTVAVDFDELNDAGVFLVSGPTGAGKTSLLDAVCFALYGVVPGVRDVRSLRSHHAPPQTRPEVVLEVTIGGRRFRISRSPEWRRPKKRGEGTTREHARASLIEVVAGTERLLSSRAQEVGHELGLALGMSSDQFMQVVLLPQGEFQRFLRATSDQRQEVLQKLFGTQRFEEIEEWMRDHTRELATTAERQERRVAQLLATLAHRSGVALAEPLAEDQLGDVAAGARRWAREVLGALQRGHREAVVREATAQEEVRRAEGVAAEAARLAAAAGRRAAALCQLDTLTATAGAAAEQAERLACHERALPVRAHLEPLASLREEHRRAVETASSGSATALSSPAVRHHLERGVGVTSPTPALLERWADSWGECRTIRDALVDQLARLKAAVPWERAALEAAHGLDRARSATTALDREAAGLEERAETLPEELAVVEARLTELRAAAAQESSAEADEARAVDRHRAAAALPAATARHQALVDRWRDARDRAGDARAHHLDLLGRRLAGIASELAGKLADGVPCQVCGSCDHPAPARATTSSVTDEDQAAAEATAERLRGEVEALAVEVEASTRRLVELERGADGSVDAAAAALDAARATLASARRASAAVPAAERERLALQQEARLLADRRAEAHRARGTLTAEATAAEQRLGEAHAALEAAMGMLLSGDGSFAARAADGVPLTRLVDDHERGLGLVERLIERLAERDRLADRLAEATTRAEKVAAEQGFSALEEVAAALLPASEAAELRRGAEAREDQRRSAEAVLTDPEVRRLDPAEASAADALPSPAPAEAALTAARLAVRSCTAAAAEAAGAATAVQRLVDELDEALTTWEPARRRHTTAAGVARLVRGMGADNQLQMRLSSYVLATRLDQVLDAANGRLCEMRDQRYTLRRTGTARGGSRAGLGIELLDAWTGETRNPTTLSGGETFVVSLALALGLADVVGQESGGLRVETLFIDEGFGSLDPDTLDDVMDRIDALRAGGRTVGVVSHVTELRTRVPVQLHVERGRQGSSVAVRTLVA